VRADGGDHECFVPKKTIQRWGRAHARGVQAVSFLPGTGHLMLTAGLDGAAKLWDVLAQGRPLRRTFSGHGGAVRAAHFSPTDGGARVCTASYDRRVAVWDVETGACALSLDVGSVPYSAAWSPSDPSSLLVGTARRKVLQYDLRVKPGGESSVAVEYDHHLGPVNTLTFFDGGRKFVSTGDDKKVLVWEYGAPVPIKYITDPAMHAIPTVTMHPSGECFAGQSMDNNIVVYSAGDRVSLNRKKHFAGHVTAGYACQIAFSPDGRHITSGDGEGTLWFWEWRTGRFEKKLRAHAGGPCIGTVWHPLRPSTMATCGWDGVINLLE